MTVQISDGRLVFVRPAIIDGATSHKISVREGALPPPPTPRVLWGGSHKNIFQKNIERNFG